MYLYYASVNKSLQAHRAHLAEAEGLASGKQTRHQAAAHAAIARWPCSFCLMAASEAYFHGRHFAPPVRQAFDPRLPIYHCSIQRHVAFTAFELYDLVEDLIGGGGG